MSIVCYHDIVLKVIEAFQPIYTNHILQEVREFVASSPSKGKRIVGYESSKLWHLSLLIG